MRDVIQTPRAHAHQPATLPEDKVVLICKFGFADDELTLIIVVYDMHNESIMSSSRNATKNK